MNIQILLFQIQLFFQLTNAYWWYLGLQIDTSSKKQLTTADNKNLAVKPNQNLFDINKPKFVSGLKRYCKSLRVLNSPVQRRLCFKNDKIIEVIARGAKLAIDECQYQFKFKRWNCTIFNKVNVFGRLIETRSRETAFIYAINSAAAMYEITKSCSKGELSGCSCSKKIQSTDQNTPEAKLNHNIGPYAWGGCSDNVLYGHRLSKHFVDAKELSGSSRPIRVSDDQSENVYANKEYKLMNLHNNEVGRRIILKNMKQICKCHGVSGSCSVKVCWKVMPEFRVIGNELIKRYNLAAQIRDVEVKNRVQKLKMLVSRRSVNLGLNKRQDLKDELIFIDKSPNFCRQDPKFSTLGTSGRMCKIVKKSQEKKTVLFQNFYTNNSTLNDNEDDATLQTCDHLCCGRGYYSKMVEIEEDCDCQFQWCCSVKCKKCKKKIIQYFCN
ncbi:unnamed protein product [Brachionus calyciflorus]|uniref:Protein Wnt n=1 Tax=Brachionus calyciflorus TaxID=104777 RepID=A0A813M841_9BILA|nr:unnamed protein product [Brachionus calyciflorus]